jgi:hypothetical protein
VSYAKRTPIVLPFVVISTVTIGPALANDAAYVSVQSMQIGSQSQQLGYEHGDTDDIVASISVGIDGSMAFTDRANKRIMALTADAAFRFVGERPSGTPSYESPQDVLPLTGGEVATLWSGNGFVLVIYGADGQVRKRTPGKDMQFDTELPDGSFVAIADDKYITYDRSLRLTSASAERPTSLGKAVKAGDKSWIVRTDGRCIAVPDADVGMETPRIAPGKLLFVSSHVMGRFDISDSALTLWKIPRDSGGRHLLGTDLGQDESFFSLVRTSDHYEIVRWNLSALETKVLRLSPVAPPELAPLDNKVVRKGEKVHFFVKVTAPEGEFTFSCEPLPQGAALEVGGTGRRATFDWSPRTRDIGQHVITFVAQDERCQRSSQTVTITVNP